MKTKEIRSIKLDNVSAQEDGDIRYIYGKIPYNTKSQKMYIGYSNCRFEKLDRNVFHKTLGDKSNVFANYSHDQSKILGSTKSNTLELEDKEDGLYIRCKVPNTSWGNDTWEVISRGDVTTMSFEFIPYDWVDDQVEDTVTLRSAKLEAVAFCVAEPAYLETDSYASFRKRNIDLEKLSEAIDEGKVTEDVKKLAKTLNDLIAKEEERVKEEEAKEKEKPEEKAKEEKAKEEKAKEEKAKEEERVKEEKEKQEKEKQEKEPEAELEEIKEQPKVEEKAVEKEQSADTPNNDTKTETEVDEEYKKKLEQLKDLEKELSTVLESM